MCICLCLCMRLFNACTHVSAYVHACACLRVCIYIYVYMCVCMFIHMYKYTCVYICLCVCIEAHAWLVHEAYDICWECDRMSLCHILTGWADWPGSSNHTPPLKLLGGRLAIARYWILAAHGQLASEASRDCRFSFAAFLAAFSNSEPWWNC